MNKILSLILLFLAFQLLLSCEKEETPDPQNVYAGIYDLSFLYHEFSPALELNFQWDLQNLYGEASELIDLDNDGVSDLSLNLTKINSDSLHLLSGLPNPFPSFKILPENGLEIATYSETFPIGLGQTGTAIFIDRLNYNENIDSLENWESTGNKMWHENPGGLASPPFGAWYYASTENYLAIRISGDKYGWIKIDATDPKNPKIISHAIQK